MAYTNDSEPSGSWTNDSIDINSIRYNDAQVTYNQSTVEYNETDEGVAAAWDFDSKP